MPPRPSSSPPGAILASDSLAGPNWLVHGFSTRLRPGRAAKPSAAKNGFNLGFTEGTPRADVERNRRDFLAALDGQARPWTLVQVKQVHSDIIHVLDAAPAHPLSGDGLITGAPGLMLAVKTADCVPVLIADAVRRVVGAFHAGWRGTAKRVVEKGVGILRRDFGSDPHDLRAAIGPSIRACCYAVGDEVREQFDSQFAYAGDLFVEHLDVDPVRQKYPNLFLTARAPGHAEISRQLHLDLAAANRRQLLDAGVPDANIGVLPFCTACRTDLLFSHRAEHGHTGRMMAAIGIRQ